MLTLLIILPLLFSILIVFIRKPWWVKSITLISAIIQLVLSIILVFVIKSSPGFQYTIHLQWIPSLGINFFLGIDGIGALMVLLTNLLILFIILMGLKKEIQRIHIFYSLILVSQAALMGVFLSLNAFLFYVFWEITLLPIYFIVLLWGRENCRAVTFKFILYNLLGSLFMLSGFMLLYLMSSGLHSIDITSLYGLPITKTTQRWIFLLIFIGCAVKTPLFPFHTWMPGIYASAPVEGTILLSGIMSKMGIFCLLRWLIPILPAGALYWQNTLLIIAIAGVIYGGIIAVRQSDIKTFFAYSSLSHMSLIAAGVFAFNAYSLNGSMIQMFAHGINMAGLFYIMDIIENRTGARLINQTSGIRNHDPLFASIFMIILLGAIGLPLTNGFIGEFLILLGIFKVKMLWTILGGTTIILSAIYMLYIYQKLMLGKSDQTIQPFKKIDNKEKLVLLPIATIVILLGIFPQPILNLIAQTVTDIIKHFTLLI